MTDAPAWLTVNVWPPIVSEPLRELVLVLPSTEYETVALPVPLVALVMCSHVALAVAVQVQVFPVFRPALPAPAPEPNEALLEARE